MPNKDCRAKLSLGISIRSLQCKTSSSVIAIVGGLEDVKGLHAIPAGNVQNIEPHVLFCI